MTSDRQRAITREQVLCKLNDAKRRADECFDAALKAKDPHEYAQIIEVGTKAAYDYGVWYKVLASLS